MRVAEGLVTCFVVFHNQLDRSVNLGARRLAFDAIASRVVPNKKGADRTAT